MNRDNDKTFDASKVEGFSVSFALRARKELSNERKFEWSSGTLVLLGSFFLSPLFFFFLFFSYEKSNSQPVEENSKLKSNAFKNLFSAWTDALKNQKSETCEDGNATRNGIDFASSNAKPTSVLACAITRRQTLWAIRVASAVLFANERSRDVPKVPTFTSRY